ncbi:MAG: hydrogenase, partial [Spirochaetales bacterium]|nr:hydrogenase [Spirochaetales bacterium]
MKYLEKSGRTELKSSVKVGMVVGLVGSIIIGLILWGGIVLLKGSSDSVGKLWESIASIAGLILLSTFIFWMMKHGKNVSAEVKTQVDGKVSRTGVLGLAAVVVLREGVEITLFAFSLVNERAYIIGILIGVIIAGILAYLIFLSLVKINLGLLFTVTLAYLILQAGYLLGYSIHEFLSAMKSIGRMEPDSSILIKVFNFQDTVLDHKTGGLGIPLNILIGWYSRPEWIQLILHYGYVVGMMIVWRQVRRKQAAEKP